jgi:hypothetical protein
MGIGGGVLIALSSPVAGVSRVAAAETPPAPTVRSCSI